MIELPIELASLRQFCCRDGKQPIIKKPITGRLTSSWKGNAKEGWKGSDGYLTLCEAIAYVANGETYWTQNENREWVQVPVDGIGFICSKEEDPAKQIVGGDLDACRDPVTGELSPWAQQFIWDTKPFYTEISPSGCGLRFFYRAHLPNRVDSLTGNGPDDLSDEMKSRILAAKPALRKKMEIGEAGWNGVELYEAKRHLTLTGNGATVSEVEDRSTSIMIAMASIATAKCSNIALAPWIESMKKDAAGKRLPSLKIEDVVRAAGFVEADRVGDQIRGSVPDLPSASGVNIVINPAENTYCWMHNGINAGGDAWVWLAHECEAAPWEAHGEGLLRDPTIRGKTIDYAISKGLVKKEDLPVTPVPPEARLRLADVAINEGKDDKDLWKFSPSKATQSILGTMKLAMSKHSSDIYYFNGQIFVPDGERVINNVLCDAGGDLATIKNKKETTTRLRDILLDYPVTFDPDPYMLGVENGVVDLRTGEFREYKPEDLITDQIRVSYDPNATCPGFIKFIKEVAPNETDQAMLVDWFAIHAIKLMFPYVMFLNGLGRNGKGVYERVLKRFYGEESFSNMPLEELNVRNNRFAGIGLYRKRGQIVSEAGEDNKKGKRTIPTNYLKNATGDGLIDTDQKNKGRIQFKPYYKATIDSNDMPIIEDTSKGWMERFCKADLPYQYVDDPDPDNHPMERKKDPKLFEKLTTDEELSGILNLVIERTIKISQSMTITRRPGEEMFREYVQQSNSVITFIEKFCDYQEMGDSRNNIYFDIVYKAYETWCNLLVCDKVDDRRFGAAIKKFCGGREPERVHVIGEDGKDMKKRVYRGLVFDANRYAALLDHYRTIKGPIKTVCSPLGPLK